MPRGQPTRLCSDHRAVPRPCPHTDCRFHLAEQAHRRGLPSPRQPSGAETCALDVADDGPHTLDEIGEILGVTRERIRQIEAGALAKLAPLVLQAGIR